MATEVGLEKTFQSFQNLTLKITNSLKPLVRITFRHFVTTVIHPWQTELINNRSADRRHDSFQLDDVIVLHHYIIYRLSHNLNTHTHLTFKVVK